MSRLQGKTALVTGGRQGIGRAIVGCFAAEGARVMTCGRGPRPADLPDTVLWQTADVADKADIDALTDRVVAEFGELSILVNNAGVQIEKTIVETTDEDWDRIVATVDDSAFDILMSRAAQVGDDVVFTMSGGTSPLFTFSQCPA